MQVDLVGMERFLAGDDGSCRDSNERDDYLFTLRDAPSAVCGASAPGGCDGAGRSGASGGRSRRLGRSGGMDGGSGCSGGGAGGITTGFDGGAVGSAGGGNVAGP